MSNLERKQPARRFAYIDCVRGIAALYVMIQHTFEYAGFAISKPGVPYNWWVNLGESGVFAFFVVSGFIIPVSLERASTSVDFWQNRVFRIYPLYLAIFLITVLIAIFLEQETIAHPLKIFVAQIFFLNSWLNLPNYVGGSWTLVIEFMWYLGIFLWWRIHGQLQSQRLVLFALVAVVAIGIFAILSPVRLPLGRLGMLLACVWGLLILERARANVETASYLVFTAALAIACTFLLYVGFGLRPHDNVEMMPFPMVIASWALGCATFFFFSTFRNSTVICNRPLAYLGTISYSVYLVHSPVLRVLSGQGLTGWPLMVIAIVSALLMASLTYRFIELPFVRASHNRKQRAEAARGAGF